jgi:CubicO group peptidase (beta-lactamase class C family)
MPPSALPTATPSEVGLSKDGLGRLSAAFAREIESRRLPGAVLLVARRGRIAFVESQGARDPKSAAPMTADAIFRIYSMTKPIVSVATMMLLEEGRLLLGEPISKYLPDLLRHTSGLTYEFRGSGAVHKRYTEAKVFRRDQTNADHAGTLAKMPLLHQPGTRWEYSRSTDVLGRLLEVVAGMPLPEFLAQRILRPLEMVDSGFHVPAAERHRLAEPFEKDPDTGDAVTLLDVHSPPMFQSGGGGMVSTAQDYARFLHMLLQGGALGGVRLLGRKTVEFMTADHLGPIPGAETLAGPGYGFGLGFAVRLSDGIAPTLGSAGQYYWGGIAGTTFWVDPREQLVAVLMMQGPGQREYYRALFRNLVYSSLAD